MPGIKYKLDKLKGAIKLFKSELEDNPPYYYGFLVSLDERDYPKYLKKIYKFHLNKEPDLKHPKTFREKIQWLKLYDNLSIKTMLTDKVLVRNWIKEKIGEKYLKPCLWIGNSFDDIPFEELPERFIIKANHGCKWHISVSNKSEFLSNYRLFDIARTKFNGWMSQTFFPVAGFELQYKNIIPKILIEPLLVFDADKKPVEYEIYRFNGSPKIFQKILYEDPRLSSVYDENFNQLDLKFQPEYSKVEEDASDNMKLAVELSKKLCGEFKPVRVDRMEYKGDLLFSEMTFTPFSGFYSFSDEWDLRLGKMLNLYAQK